MNEDQEKPDDWSFDKAFEEGEEVLDPLEGLVEQAAVDAASPFKPDVLS